MQSSKMSRKARAQYFQGYCLCQMDFCARTQKLMGRSLGRSLAHDGVTEWSTSAMPMLIHFHSSSSNYTTWLLIVSICYHIPVFLETFLKEMGDEVRKPPQEPRPRKQWQINRSHFPATLLSPLRRKKFGLSTYTKVLLPEVAQVLERLDSASVCGAVQGRIPMTAKENTVRFLEEYAQRVFPPNIYQEFLYAKRKPHRSVPDGDSFVQAPGVLSMEVIRFCALLNLPTTTTDDTTINIVRTRLLVMAVPQKPQLLAPARILATLQHGTERPKVVLQDDGSPNLQTKGVSWTLSKGGTLTIYPRMVTTEESRRLTNEIISKPDLFRQYKVQGFNNERRVQAQFHNEATDDFDKEQPGYRYNKSTTLKARPLNSIPSLKNLADRCQTLCEVPSWNIGTTIVFYRNGKDKMGQHKDNDQGETLILAVVVDAPEKNLRKVEIRSEDEIIILYLERGDGYAMDGTMQKHYTHGVPEAKETSNDTDGTKECDHDTRRISLIFRHGRKVKYMKDSGKPCLSLDPAFLYGVDKKPWFGRLRGMFEGYLYSRQDLWEMKAHGSQQKGVSGNKTDGCNAIVVSGKGEVKGEDSFFNLTYSSSTGGKGAEGMIVSCQNGLKVRVFRTTKYEHSNRAVVPSNAYYKRITGNYYRYDGLYEIKSYQKNLQNKVDGNKKEELVFQLTRCHVPHNVFDGENYRRLCKAMGTIASETM